MADIAITVDGGTSKRLLTAGKYCDKNILVTATGGGQPEPEPPADGKTRLYITVPANSMPGLPPPRNVVPLHIQQTVADGVTIDWGDGSGTETFSETGKIVTSHTYEKAGNYVISLDPQDGCELRLGTGDSSYCVLGQIDGIGNVYCSMLFKAIIGENVPAISTCAFRNCRALRDVSLGNVLYIEDSAFQNNISLASITIPDMVESIEAFAFNGLYGIKEYHLLPKTPPSLASSNTLGTLPADCVIYVPKGSLATYKTATNWSAYEDKMQEEPA